MIHDYMWKRLMNIKNGRSPDYAITWGFITYIFG